MTDISSAISEITESLQNCAELFGNLTSPPEICYELVKDVDSDWSEYVQPLDKPNEKFSENCQRHPFEVDVKVNIFIIVQSIKNV